MGRAGQFVMGVLALGALSVAAPEVWAQQQPKVLDARVGTAVAGRGLQEVLSGLKGEAEPVWMGYSVPVAGRFASGSRSDRRAYLEGDRGGEEQERDEAQRSFSQANVLLRVKNGAVEKVRVEAPARELDAHGLRFIWVDGVSAEDSVRFLAGLVKAEPRGVREAAIFAIAVHQTPAATAALVSIAAPGGEEALREKAAFWLAAQRGHDGFVAISRMAREDRDARFREKLAFDMTVTKDPGGVGELVRMAHEDGSSQVRRQAQFWMAAKGGAKVAADLRQTADSDTDAGVRKMAVFAMSRLPKEEATTQLIARADTSKDPGVRKQAVFWLGQSNDPRALEYLTKLLER